MNLILSLTLIALGACWTYFLPMYYIRNKRISILSLPVVLMFLPAVFMMLFSVGGILGAINFWP